MQRSVIQDCWDDLLAILQQPQRDKFFIDDLGATVLQRGSDFRSQQRRKHFSRSAEVLTNPRFVDCLLRKFDGKDFTQLT